jgi:tetratricopeptide (TPR) repeat protein
MLYNLANLNKARKEFSQAQPLYEEALQIYRQMAQQSPETYLLDVAMTLNNLGLLYKTQKEFSQARSLYEEALQIYRQMAQQNPKVHNLDVAMTSINIGLLYEQLLETTVDKSLKTAGLALLGDAELRLAIYPEEHLIAQQYSKYIAYLNNFFKVD